MEKYLIDKSQGWKNILKIIIPYFLFVGISELIGVYFAGLNISNYKTFQETTEQLFTITFSGLVGTVLIVWLFRKYIDRKSFISVGFDKGFVVKDSLTGLAFGFTIMLVGFSCLMLTKQIIFQSIQFEPAQFILSIGLFIFVAISEELFLRGYVLNNLMISFNKFGALIFSSVIFSLLHAPNPNFNFLGMIGLFVAGLFFGLAYIYTRSLWFPIALHFSWNFFQGTIFGFNVSGKDTYSLIVTKENVFTIWNGGNFGFEASVLSILFQLIAIAIVFIIFKTRFETDTLPGTIDVAAATNSKSRVGIRQ
ncbi:MAG: type II CAAX endopeptidase family protein [Ferruginibacter sp.]